MVTMKTCVRVKESKSECYKIDCETRLYHVPLSLQYVFIYLFIEEYHAACGPCGTISPRLQYVYGCSDEGGEDGDGKEGSEISGGGGERVEIAQLLVRK